MNQTKLFFDSTEFRVTPLEADLKIAPDVPFSKSLFIRDVLRGAVASDVLVAIYKVDGRSKTLLTTPVTTTSNTQGNVWVLLGTISSTEWDGIQPLELNIDIIAADGTVRKNILPLLGGR